MTDSDRIAREAAFHDATYATDGRAKASRYYKVTSAGFGRYLDFALSGIDGRRVLEFGCGQGSAAFDAAEKGADMVGIDISQVAIDQAEKEAVSRGVSERTSFLVMNAEDMTFADATFDRVIGSAILHHLDLTPAFREVARVLKPGGQAIFMEPLGHNPLINWYRNRTPEMRTPDEHPLLANDFDAAREFFSQIDIEWHFLTVLAAVPFVGRPGFNSVVGALSALDRVLLARRSPVRWQAWYAIVRLTR